jgi:hypothetical protein
MTEILRGVIRTVWSDGGQRAARRNAWAAMAADAKRARERAEVNAFLSAVSAVYEMPTTRTGSSHG